jgi:hypothetical protein
MPDPAKLRDSTQIVLPAALADDLRVEVESEFTVTFVPAGDYCRIVGSPVEIRDLSAFLSRRGVRVR